MKNNIEKTAEQLHIWYLEATKELNPKDFNPNAQKDYKDLTEAQKYIDRYIAREVVEECNAYFQAGFERGIQENNKP